MALTTAAVTAALVPQLVTGAAHAAYPGANGKIAFQSLRDGNLEIYVMNPDGSEQTNLTDNPIGSDFDPAWSPDGTRIAFAGGGPNNGTFEGHSNIWVMNADGSGRTNLTPGPETSGQANGGVEPSWSPDGSKIAYNHSGDIWVMNADGSGKTKLIEGAIQPAWSPLGDKIAFIKDFNLWTMNVDGSGGAALAVTSAGEKVPDWSPDGTQLTYSAAGDVFVINANGTGATNLTGATGESGQLPAFAPDGTKIVFGSQGCGAPNGVEICVMNPDGTGKTRVPSPAAPSTSDTNPSWQPVFVSAVTIRNATVTEGDDGSLTANFRVKLSGASATEVRVSFATADGTARAPADYTARSGSLRFLPGQTAKTVRVTVVGDNLSEASERFFVNLTGATNATIADNRAVGTILDDD